jgi:hypothetical protein
MGEPLRKQDRQQIPSGKSLASRPVVNSTGKPGNGSLMLEGTRVQAVLLTPEICLVVVVRITSMKREGKPT